MKNLYLFLLFSLIIIRVNSQNVTRYTPTGVSVYAERSPEIYSEAYL
jgi:hypothetical protein